MPLLYPFRTSSAGVTIMNINYSIASDYLYGIFSLLEESGISPLELCNQQGIYIPNDEQVSLNTLKKMLNTITQSYDLPEIGLLLGMKMASSSHGFLGYAAKSSETIADALMINEQFITTRIHGVQFQTTMKDNRCRVTLLMADELEEQSRFVVELIFSSLIRFFNELFPNIKLLATVNVGYAKPYYAPLYETLTSLSWRFNQNSHYLEFPQDFFTLKLPTYDIQLRDLSVQQCIKNSSDLSSKSTLADKVITLLSNDLAEPPLVNEVALSLGLNQRTFKRYLHEQGQSYQKILRELRVKKAKQLLTTTSITIDNLAFQLGYSSPATFKRLFKKWTGVSPGELRKNST